MDKDTEINSLDPTLVVETIDTEDVYARHNRTGKYAKEDRDEAARKAVEQEE